MVVGSLQFVRGEVWLIPRWIRKRATSGSEPPCHHENFYTSFLTRDISTTMDLILAAIAAIDSLDPAEQLLYRAAAKKFGVD
jgi:hypothetical protein